MTLGAFDHIVLPVYVINLKENPDRLNHIRQQFAGKDEFEVHVVEAIKHSIGNVGLWQTIKVCVRKALENDDDVIIICEDDHEFTEHYSKEFLIGNILEAHAQGCDILSGGIGGFNNAVPLSCNRYWIDSFWCTQFMVIYRKFFEAILHAPFEDNDTVDGKYSDLTSHKMVLYPFISIQKDFGYSDVTKHNNDNKGLITKYFTEAESRFKLIEDACIKYNVAR